MWDKSSKCQEQPVQRPRGRNAPGLCEDHQGGQGSWSGVSKGDNGKSEGQRGDRGRLCGASWAKGLTLAFTLSETELWDSSEQSHPSLSSSWA